MAAKGDHDASSSTAQWAYDVFLCFRGKDVRRTFIDHLYTALVKAGIRTFRDDDEIERGENIKLEVEKAIKRSRISIVVFSKDYASSEWCLDELVKIIESHRNSGQIIFPVFYDVEPSEVWNQNGTFGKALGELEKEFEGEADERKKEMVEKVNRWKAALSEVANLGGRVLQHEANWPASRFIQDIVKEIGSKLNRTVLNVTPHLIGIAVRIKKINSWVQDGSKEVGVFAIYGMGGIGKTTIAKTVYNQNFDQFESSSFLANIREASGQPNGLVHLQRQLLSDILKWKARKVNNVDEGISRIKAAVSCKRVLLVLDDVDELDDLNAIFGMREWFHPGSKIIITTRREKLLKACAMFEMYKVQELDDKESLQLLSWHAFGQDHPLEAYMGVSERLLKHCGGNPLALQVLGSSMSGKNINIWESAIKKLEAIPNTQILNKLKVSYDSLEDDHDKELFLDIICFFLGKKKDYVFMILDGCDYYTTVGIQNLIHRCLLTISEDDRIMMHDLLRDMGREIIRQESLDDPGKRSRLWHHKDSLYVLTERTGTEWIRSLALDMQMFMEEKPVRIFSDDAKGQHYQDIFDELVEMGLEISMKRRRLEYFKGSVDAIAKIHNAEDLKTDAFVRMKELRLLKLHYVKLTGSYKEFPKKLKWVYWSGFPLKYIPTDFPLESVVALEMHYSSLQEVWRGTKVLRLLRFLNLSHSHSLTKTPDFSALPNLETLILKGCIRLITVHESIGELEKLAFLNLKDCKNLHKLPENICKLKSLKNLILSGCSKLIELPIELGKLDLTILHADKIALNQLVPNRKSRRAQFWSWVSNEKGPEPIKFSLASFSKSLVELSLVNCSLSNDAIPSNLSSLPLLQFLNLSQNPIGSLPESIKYLYMLKDLWLDSCTNLQSLPELPPSLVKLKAQNCTSLERITNLPNLLKSLFLDVSDCNKLVEVWGLFKLEPIGNFILEMIKLGFNDLECIEKLQVELFNNMTKTKTKCPVQGLHEFGIFSTSVPGNGIPDWFSHKAEGASVSFIVPSLANMRIQAFNICFVYARSSDRKFKYFGDSKSGNWFSYYIKINNKTRGLKWVYSPTFLGIPGSGENMTWLSHWKFENCLQVGDEVRVSVVGLSLSFLIKECGISFVQEEQKHEGKFLQSEEDVNKHYSVHSHHNTIDGVLPAYQMNTNAYFLSNSDYFMLSEGSEDHPTRAVLYENLFGDSGESTGHAYEEDEEYESDDYYDDKYDEMDVDEFMALLDWQ